MVGSFVRFLLLGKVTSRAEREDAHAIHYGQWYSSELINYHMIPLYYLTDCCSIVSCDINILRSQITTDFIFTEKFIGNSHLSI